MDYENLLADLDEPDNSALNVEEEEIVIEDCDPFSMCDDCTVDCEDGKCILNSNAVELIS